MDSLEPKSPAPSSKKKTAFANTTKLPETPSTYHKLGQDPAQNKMDRSMTFSRKQQKDQDMIIGPDNSKARKTVDDKSRRNTVHHAGDIS